MFAAEAVNGGAKGTEASAREDITNVKLQIPLNLNTRKLNLNSSYPVPINVTIILLYLKQPLEHINFIMRKYCSLKLNHESCNMWVVFHLITDIFESFLNH